MDDWQQLLVFWFGQLDEGLADAEHRAQWFKPSVDFDTRARDLFGAAVENAANGGLTDWLANPRGRLAYILVCDQIPRNIFCGTEAAFATDQLALRAAREGIEEGYDPDLHLDERCFFYMPFEHSEAILEQHVAVGLFTALRDVSPKPVRHIAGNYLRFAQQHRDIILQCGRFPHRNDVLGRESSVQEKAFVAAGDGFGQILN